MKLVFWVGATGTGKSDWALTQAELYQADIINADSIQMYRELDKGSAKPTAADFKRRPHHLFDFVPYPHTVTAGDYSRLFFDLMRRQEKSGHPQFVVGGTGFYFQAIEKGVLDIPKTNPETQRRLMEELKSEGGEARLYERLRDKDPTAAERIHANDHYRLIRALDIIEATGESLTSALERHKREAPPFPYSLLKIGLKVEKSELEERLRRRTRVMLESGWLDEVKNLMDRSFADWEPMSSVGYRECVQFLRGNIQSREDLENMILRETLRLAKKQRTWFQRDPQIKWFHPADQQGIESALAEFLGKALTK